MNGAADLYATLRREGRVILPAGLANADQDAVASSLRYRAQRDGLTTSQTRGRRVISRYMSDSRAMTVCLVDPRDRTTIVRPDAL